MMKTRSYRGAALLWVLFAPLAVAAESDRESRALEEIIVTATKRLAAMQDVPISIRALSEQELRRLGADSMQDYANFTPGLQLIPQGPALTQITMRGVSTGQLPFDRAELRETVGLYFDETPISVQRFSPNLALYDLDRIEVIRGPQGTLFGAGSLSGTVRMLPHKPDPGAFDLTADVTGSFTDGGADSTLVNAMVNVPLQDERLALRAVAVYRDVGGVTDNALLGLSNVDDAEERGGRLALRFLPTDALALDLRLMHGQSERGDSSAWRPAVGDFETNVGVLESLEDEMTLADFTGTYDMRFATLTSVSSYFKKDFVFVKDGGGLTEILTGVEDDIFAAVPSVSRQEEFTQEIRLASNADGRIEWVGGVFFQRQENFFNQDIPIDGIDALLGIDSTDLGAAPDNLFHSDIDVDTDQFAVFGDLTGHLTERLSLTGGMRWFHARQHSEVDFDGIFGFPTLDPEQFDNTEEGFNPKANVSFQVTPDKLLYAQAARGFRLGGTNEPIPSTLCEDDLAALGLSGPPEAFSSDSLWNYELGAKTEWLDRRLVVNAAAYLIDWRDAPVATGLPCGFSVVLNTGSLEVKGLELEVGAVLAEGLRFHAGGAYIDSELAEDAPALGGRKGDETPFVAKRTLSAALDYDFKVAAGDWNGFMHADYQYVSTRNTAFSETSSNFFELPSYDIANVRVGLGRNEWRLELFVDNVFDEQALYNEINQVFSETAGIAVYSNRPRTYGARLSFTLR